MFELNLTDLESAKLGTVRFPDFALLSETLRVSSRVSEIRAKSGNLTMPNLADSKSGI